MCTATRSQAYTIHRFYDVVPKIWPTDSLEIHAHTRALIQYVCCLVIIMLDWRFVGNLEVMMIRAMYASSSHFPLSHFNSPSPSPSHFLSLAKHIQRIRINFIFRLATKCIGTYIGLHILHNLVFTRYSKNENISTVRLAYWFLKILNFNRHIFSFQLMWYTAGRKWCKKP